eukprot:7011457-Alexandrium_andersonii.AAC.1
MFTPCLLHVLHRSVVPIMHSFNIPSELYRAAHILHVGSYWMSLVKSCRQVVSKAIAVTHNLDVDPVDRAVAQSILRLCLCKGLPDEMLSQRVKRDRDALLDTLTGDWSSGVV